MSSLDNLQPSKLFAECFTYCRRKFYIALSMWINDPEEKLFVTLSIDLLVYLLLNTYFFNESQPTSKEIEVDRKCSVYLIYHREKFCFMVKKYLC